VSWLRISLNLRPFVKLLCLFVLSAATSCVGPIKLATGSYEELNEPGVIAFTGRTLHLNPDHTFFYTYWSDDLASSKYGTGTYQLAHQKLRLVFGNTAQPVAQVQAFPLAARPDSLVLTFLVQSLEDSVVAVPLAEATIVARAASTPAVGVGVTTDAMGRATLRLARAALPSMLAISHVGFSTWQQACPASDAFYVIKLTLDRGTPYEVGTVKELRVRRHRGQQVVLAQGKRILVPVAQAVR
jgi:hypothetical protein